LLHAARDLTTKKTKKRVPQKTNNLRSILAGPCSGTPWYAVKMEIAAHLLADRVPQSFRGVANAMQATGHEDKKL
jgi:hypothetical protein